MQFMEDKETSLRGELRELTTNLVE